MTSTRIIKWSLAVILATAALLILAVVGRGIFLLTASENLTKEERELVRIGKAIEEMKEDGFLDSNGRINIEQLQTRQELVAEPDGGYSQREVNIEELSPEAQAYAAKHAAKDECKRAAFDSQDLSQFPDSC